VIGEKPVLLVVPVTIVVDDEGVAGIGGREVMIRKVGIYWLTVERYWRRRRSVTW